MWNMCHTKSYYCALRCAMSPDGAFRVSQFASLFQLNPHKVSLLTRILTGQISYP